MKALALLLLCMMHKAAYTYQQDQVQDSLCCTCMKYDTSEIRQIYPYKTIIFEMDSSYLHHLISLSENVDLIQYEKYQYLLKTDKLLKYELSKKMFALEAKKDTALSMEAKLRYGYLNEILKAKIQHLDNKVTQCERLQLIQHYNRKKTVVNNIDPDYFASFVSLINSTIEDYRVRFDELIKLENRLLHALEIKRYFLNKKDPAKLTLHEKQELELISELIEESKKRIEKFTYDKSQVQIPESSVSTNHLVPNLKDYVLKEIIKNYDTIQRQGYANREQVIVINNTMYLLRNDSLIETIQNQSESELASIFEVKKPISVDNYDGLFYTVQIGTYSREIPVSDLKVSSNLFYKVLPDGKIRYSYGICNSLEEVERAKATLKMLGITDVVAIAYYQKEKVTLKQAKKIQQELQAGK